MIIGYLTHLDVYEHTPAGQGGPGTTGIAPGLLPLSSLHWLALLLPHIRRACGMDERLMQARLHTAAPSETLYRVSEAAALIDAAGRVKHANRAATLIFSASDGLALAHDARILFANQDARDAFQRALGQSGSPLILLSTGTTSPPVQIAVPRSRGRPLLLTLQPLPQEMKGALGAVATLSIGDPEAKPADRTAALRTAYRLSPTELRVAQAMAEGESIKAFAIRNQMSYETARTSLAARAEKSRNETAIGTGAADSDAAVSGGPPSTKKQPREHEERKARPCGRAR